MQALADITIRCHDSEPDRFSPIRQGRIVQCYRVVGGNVPAAGHQCLAYAGRSPGTGMDISDWIGQVG